MAEPTINIGDTIQVNEWRGGPNCFLNVTITSFCRDEDTNTLEVAYQGIDDEGDPFEHWAWWHEESNTWQSGDM